MISSMNGDLKAELERAVWHVAKAKEIVARQVALISALRGTDYACSIAQATLHNIILASRVLEDLERLMHEQIDFTAAPSLVKRPSAAARIRRQS